MWCFMKRLANGSSTTGLAVLFLNIKVQPVKLQLIINISCFLFKQNKQIPSTRHLTVLSARTQLFKPWSRTKVSYYFIIEKSVIPVVHKLPESKPLKITFRKMGLDKFFITITQESLQVWSILLHLILGMAGCAPNGLLSTILDMYNVTCDFWLSIQTFFPE